MRPLLLIALLLLCTRSVSRAEDFLPGARRIVFLGDSITYAGEYVDFLETYFLVHFPDRKFEIIDVGLPSETVSGLSEKGHAGGQFPRPDLHERLDRVLAKTKPDLVFACYGMNDGIYLPFAEERFAKFRDGIERLRASVEATGAKVIHLTPPTFDPGPLGARAVAKDAKGSDKPFELYNDTLDRYSEWLLAQRAKGWRVIDVHGPMDQALAERRASNPDFRFAGDGVHPSVLGHWIIARAVLDGLGQATDDFTSNARYTDLIKLIHARGRILTDAWLTETGHKRPGMNKGLPLAEAQAKAAELEPKIREAAAALAGNP